MNGRMNVFFIDDEPKGIELHAEVLEGKGYHVDVMDKSDDAFAFCKRNDLEIDLLILDVMAPVPRGANAVELEDGSRTGIFFLEKYRCWDQTTPILLFSHRSVGELIEEAWSAYLDWLKDKGRGLPDQLSREEMEQELRAEFKVWVRMKSTTRPFMIPTIVRDILETANIDQSRADSIPG